MINLSASAKELSVDSSKLSARERIGLLFRLMREVAPYWDKLVLRALCTQCTAFLDVLGIIIYSRLVDVATLEHDVGAVGRFVLLALGVLFLSRILWFIAAPSNNYMGPMSVMGFYMQAKIGIDMKTRFYRHIQDMSLRFFQTRPVGEHMFRASLDIDDSSFLASEVIPIGLSVIQRIVMACLALQIVAGAWTFIPIAMFLAVFFVGKHWVTTQIRKWDRRFRVESQRNEATLREILVSDKLIRGYNRQRTAKRWYMAQAGRAVKMLFRKELFFYWDFFTTASLMQIFMPFIALFAGTLVLVGSGLTLQAMFGESLAKPLGWLFGDSTVTLGAFVAIGGLIWQVVQPIQDVITYVQMIRQKLVPVERMIETLDVPRDLVDPEDDRRLPEVDGRVELRDVCFSYDGEAMALDHVNLLAQPGEKIAIVGPIGAGKTTLTNLLLRMYDPDEGQVLIDDVDVRKVTQASLRKNFGIVMQNTDMFSESLSTNILYAAPLASKERMKEAAELAGVAEFVPNLRDGYDTQLSEEGSISGGQKQRVGIARALVRDPQILVMDEGTSSLDPVTEKMVVEGIDEKFEGRTRIIVAHNLTNARSADRIYVLDEGRVVETGRHEELMAKGGAYAKLWTTQS